MSTVTNLGYIGGNAATAIEASSFTIPSGAGSGKVLTSDANGNATWETAVAGYTVPTVATGFSGTGLTMDLTNFGAGNSTYVDAKMVELPNDVFALHINGALTVNGTNPGGPVTIAFNASATAALATAGTSYTFSGGAVKVPCLVYSSTDTLAPGVFTITALGVMTIDGVTTFGTGYIGLGWPKQTIVFSTQFL